MNTLIFLTLSGLALGNPTEPLQAREGYVDRGDVKAGMPLRQTFTLTNQGRAEIVITELDAGCGCVMPRASKKSLQPGESTEVSVDVNTLSQNSGPNVWKLTVRYHHGLEGQRAAGELALAIKGNVIREISVEPVSLFLSIERQATHTITISDRRAKPLTITSAVCDSKHVKMQFTAPGLNSHKQRIQQVQVTVLETIPAGHSMFPLVFLTDDPDYRELRVPLMVTRRAAGEAVATPDVLDLRLAKGQKAASGLVRLRVPDDKPLEVDRIEADNSVVRFKSATGPGQMVTLRIGVELEGARVSGLASVKVVLKEPKGQVIVIPVSWHVP